MMKSKWYAITVNEFKNIMISINSRIIEHVNGLEIVKKKGNYEKKYSEYYYWNEITVTL
jgi:hypothetical protein